MRTGTLSCVSFGHMDSFPSFNSFNNIVSNVRSSEIRVRASSLRVPLPLEVVEREGC